MIDIEVQMLVRAPCYCWVFRKFEKLVCVHALRQGVMLELAILNARMLQIPDLPYELTT